MGNEILIGDRLRQARLNKNISIDELQKISKIQKRYLLAIEAGEFDKLPGDYYVRSFLRAYASVVGENGDYLVAVFDDEATFGEELPKRPRPETAEGSRTALHQEEKRAKTVMDYLPMILLGLIAVTIIAIVGFSFWQDRQASPIIGNTTSAPIIMNETTTTETSTEETTQETTESSEPEVPEMAIERTTSEQGFAAFEITNVEKPAVITLRGKNDRCWVGITTEGTSGYLFQQTLASGDEEKVTLPEDATAVEFNLGASANIEIEINGEKVDLEDPQFRLLQKRVQLTITYLD